MKKYIFIVLILTTIYLTLNTSPTFAQSKILINEFLIDPQPQLVEIFNFGTESADISDWVIDDSGGTTFYTISKESVVFPNQCLVFSGDFNLNKTSADTIRLINNSQQLIDVFSYKSSSGSGVSYFRIPDGTDNWASGSANLGKYNNNVEQTCLYPTITPTQTPNPSPSPTLTDSNNLIKGSVTPDPYAEISVSPTPYELQPTPSFENIYLSEAMVNPPSGEKEWVEIFNDNDFPVSLVNWYIDDFENSGYSPKIFSLTISGKNYATFEFSSSIFNNDADSVRLLDFDKNIKDYFEYQKTERGKTLGRTYLDSNDFCLQEPSKNYVNNQCINPSPTSIDVQTPKLGVSTNITPTKNIMQTKIPINTGRETRPLQYTYQPSPEVLGLSDELIIVAPNQKPIINLLTSLGFSYSLLTICSILFRMKLSYGKNKNFYSSLFYSP